MNIGLGLGIGRGGSARPVFDASPYYSAGIQLDLDAASAYVTKDGSDRVSAWADRRSLGYGPVQGTGANQPLWVDAVTPSGAPAIRLDSTARFLVKAAGYLAASALGYTWFGVCKMPSGAGSGVSSFLHSNGTSGCRPLSRSGAGITTHTMAFDTSTYLVGPVNDGLLHVFCYRCAASGGTGTALTTGELYIDNVLQSVTGTPNFVTGPASYQLGANGSSRVDSYWARILEAPATLLSVPDCQAIMSGLMSTYL